MDEWSKQARDLLLGFAEKINLPNRYCLHIPDSEALKDHECVVCVVFLKILVQLSFSEHSENVMANASY